MHDFEYIRPKTIAEAVNFLDSQGSNVRILAGGTDLIIQLRNNDIQPSFILDLKNIPELQTGIQIKNRLCVDKRNGYYV